jgi:predicted transcriptional regulator
MNNRVAVKHVYYTRGSRHVEGGAVDEQRRAPGALEKEILVILSTQQGALTPAQVRRVMGRELAYTTVMTVLTRLHDKGLVQRKRVGRAFAYRWVADRAALTSLAMGRLLHGVDDRAAVLARFVGELSPTDVQILASLMHRIEPRPR